VAAVAGLVAHGGTLGAIAEASLALLAVGVIGLLAWVGSRRDKDEHEKGDSNRSGT
jgi:hypothetical protein